MKQHITPGIVTDYDFCLTYNDRCPYNIQDMVVASPVVDDNGVLHRFNGIGAIELIEQSEERAGSRKYRVYVRIFKPISI